MLSQVACAVEHSSFLEIAFILAAGINTVKHVGRIVLICQHASVAATIAGRDLESGRKTSGILQTGAGCPTLRHVAGDHASTMNVGQIDSLPRLT